MNKSRSALLKETIGASLFKRGHRHCMQPSGQSDFAKVALETARKILRSSGADHALKVSVLARNIDVACSFLEHVEKDELQEIAASNSNAQLLYREMMSPALFGFQRDTSPLTEARLRGFKLKHEMLNAEGGCFTSAEAAKQLGISRQAVHKRRLKNRLIGVELQRRGYWYPKWQFEDKILGALPRVLEALKNTVEDDWDILRFLLTEDHTGQKPLEALRHGETDAVLAAADIYDQHVGR